LKKNVFILIYFTILLICTTYQDFNLVNKFGELARSPIFLFVPIFIFYEFFRLKSRTGNSLSITVLQKNLGFYFLTITFVGIIPILYYFLNGQYVFLKENLFLKYIKGLAYIIIIFLYIRHVYFIMSRLSRRQVFYSFLTALTFLNIVLIVEYFSMPEALLFLHSKDIPYYRIRLLTAESSWTGTIYVVYSSISLYLATMLYSKKIFYKVYIILSFLMYGLLTQSKGFFIVLLLSIILYSFKYFSLRKVSIRNFMLVFIFIGLFFVIFGVFGEFYYSAFMRDVENYTSLATRIGLTLAGLKVFLTHPLGTGTGTYIVSLSKEILNSFNTLNSIFESIFKVKPNLLELQRLTTSTVGLSVKSGVLQWLTIGGVFSLLFFLFTFKHLNKATKKVSIIRFSFIFTVLAVTTYISLDIKYEVWLLFTFIEYNLKFIERNSME
jgi:hypothetical protein